MKAVDTTKGGCCDKSSTGTPRKAPVKRTALKASAGTMLDPMLPAAYVTSGRMPTGKTLPEKARAGKAPAGKAPAGTATAEKKPAGKKPAVKSPARRKGS